MSNMKYKVGDRVRVVSSSRDSLPVGTEATIATAIEGAYPFPNDYQCVSECGEWDWYLEQDLAPIEEPAKEETKPEDIESYGGWIRVTTSLPKNYEDVLVTDGKSVWIGDHSVARRPRERWSVVYNGAPPFDSTEIIAWAYFPSVPESLKNG